MKQNDYIIASMNNPDLNAGEFRVMGMDMDNTLMLSEDQYLQSDYIKSSSLFKDENGDFSKLKFHEFYNDALLSFLTFSSVEDDFQYDMYDYRRYESPTGNVKSPNLLMVSISNPDENTISDGWINQINESPFSYRELAEKNKIWSTEEGKFLDYSPNDHALFLSPLEWIKDIFKDPLVVAKWDSDGTHLDPVTGQEVEHHKGDRKLNDEGKYYYETLNGRSIAGQEILSGFDTLTVDGSALNKIDFFDSDDKEKSIGGTIMKTAAAIAPMFMGPIGTAYSTALVLREFGKVLPMIESLLHLVTGDDTDTVFTKWANNIAGKMTAATSSLDDYAMAHPWALSNIANLASDVALLWGQQKVIANAFAKLKGQKQILKSAENTAFETWKKNVPKGRAKLEAEGVAKEIIDLRYGSLDNIANWKNTNYGLSLLNNALLGVQGKLDTINRLGADMSLVYMALVSNPDVYSTMLEHGTTKREASLVALGSTLAMFSVDKYLHLGEMFFDELTNDGIKSIRATLKHESKSWAKTLAELIKGKAANSKGVREILARSTTKFKGVYKDFFDNLQYHSLNGLGKAFGEGLEEVTEEFSTDLSKLIYEWAAQWKPTNDLFGGLTTDDVGAFDNALDNPDWIKDVISRYGLNFFGGFLGGGIFYAKERFDRKDWKRDTFNDNLIHNVRSYGKNEVMKILDDYHKKGKLGSTKLSARMQYVDGTDSPVFLSADTDGKSQNDFVYDMLAKEIDGIDSIINDNTIVKSDDDLMEKLTLGDVRFMRMSDLLLNDYSKGLQNRYSDLITAYTKCRLLMQLVLKDIMQADSNIELKNQKREILEKLQLHRETLELKMKDFYSGENAIDYMGRVLYSIDPNFSGVFNLPDFKSWLHSMHVNASGEYTFDSLTDELYEALNNSEKTALYLKWQEWKKAGNKGNDEQAWEAFKYVRDKISPHLIDLGNRTGDYKLYLKDIDEIINPEKNPLLNARKFKPDEFSTTTDDPLLEIDYDYKLPDETLEEYDLRSTLLAGESDADFLQRVNARLEKMKVLAALNRNNEALQAGFEKIKDVLHRNSSFIDPELKRKLKLLLSQSQREVINDALDSLNFKILDDDTTAHIKHKLESVKDDLSDIDSVTEDLDDYVSDHFYDKITESLERLNNYRELIRWNYASIFGDRTNSNLYDDGLIAAGETTEINGVNTLMNLFAEIENAHKQILDFFEDFVTDGELDYNAVRDRILKDVIIAHTKPLTADQKDKVKTWLKDNKSWDDVQCEQIDNNNVDAANMQDVHDAIFELGYKEALTFNPNNLTDYEYTAIFDNFVEINNDNMAKGKEDLIPLILKLVLRLKSGFARGFELNEDMIKYADQENMTEESPGKYDANSFKLHKKDGRIDYQYYLDYINSIFRPIGTIRFSMQDIYKMFSDDGHGYLDLNNFMSILNNAEGINARKLIEEDPDGRIMSVDPKMDMDEEADYVTAENNVKTKAKLAIDIFKMRIQGNTLWSLIQELNLHTTIDNPIIPIVKSLGLSMDIDITNIIDLLNKIELMRDTSGYLSFTLSQKDILDLEDAQQLLSIAKAFVMAARKGTSITNPFPHNELINTVALKNGFTNINYPTMDEELASLYLSTIINLLNEIGYVDANGNYTPFSILDWNNKNAYNKLQQFINSRKKNIEAKLLLFDLNKDLLQSSDGGYNFIPNYNAILSSSDSSDVKLARIELDFHDSFNAFIQDNPGLTIEEILDKTNLNLFFNNPNNEAIVRDQETSALTDNIKYGSLTAYDKLMYIFTIANISSNDFDKFQNDFTSKHPDIAALDIQLSISRIGLAAIHDPFRWNSMMQWLHKSIPTNRRGMKPLYINAVFETGNGGAGKTQVIIRLQLEYASKVLGYDDSLIIYSGPKDSLIESLSKLGIGKAMKYKDLLKHIFGESQYNSIREEITNPSGRTRITNIGSYLTVDDNATITYDNTDLKVIVIDEATWIDGVDVALLSRYAKDNNATLILIGDDFLTGVRTNDNIEWSISNVGATFAARSPRLGITLRDCNILKYNDILTFTEFIKQLNLISSTDPDYRIKLDEFIQNLQDNILLHYYLGSELNGNLITERLSDEIINKLLLNTSPNKKEPLAYFGSNTETMQKLKAKFGDGNVIQFENINDILGQEFSNIIVDQDLELHNIHDSLETLDWLQKIYMLKTRGKNAAVFIDPNHKLDLIHNILDSYKNNVSNFNIDSIKLFNEVFKEYCEKRGVASMNYSTISTTPTTVSATSSGTTTTSSTTGSGTRFSLTIDDGSSMNEGTELGVFEDEDLEKLASSNTARFSLITTEEETNKPSNLDEEVSCPDINSALVYSANTLSGMSYDELIEKRTSQSGKEYETKFRVYHPDFSANTLYDANMYAYASSLLGENITENMTYKDGQHIFFDEFLIFKKCILYKTPYEKAKELCPKIFESELISNLQYEDIINRRQNDTILFAIEVSPYNKLLDNYIGKSLLSEDEDDMTIATDKSGTKLTYKLVLKWSPETAGKKLCAITLGMLANPDTFERGRDGIVAKLNKYLLNDKINDVSGKARAKVYLSKIDTNGSKYKTETDPVLIYRQIIDTYAQLRMFLINGTSPTGEFNGFLDRDSLIIPIDGNNVAVGSTVIRTAVRNHPGTVPTLRFDINDSARAKILGKTFKENNPGMVVSPIYLYRPGNAASDGLPSIAGRCCVFVSLDPSLQSKELLSVWELEYVGKVKNKKVRMIRLDNVGVTISLLCDTNMRDMFHNKPEKWIKDKNGNLEGNSDYNVFPFASDRMGVRWFTELWNWRADMEVFKTRIQDAINDPNVFGGIIASYSGFLNSSKIRNVLLDMHEKYVNMKLHNPKLTETEFRNAYDTDSSITAEYRDIAKRINKFNDSLENTCRRFRLGIGNITPVEEHSLTKKRNEWLLREIKAKEDNPFYGNTVKKGEKVYGIYMTPLLFNNYYLITNGIMNFITKNMKITAKLQTESGWGDISITERLQNSKSGKRVVNAIWNMEDGAPFKIAGDLDFSNIRIKAIPAIITKMMGRSMAFARVKEDSEGLYLPNEGIFANRKKRIPWKWEQLGFMYVPLYEMVDGKPKFDKTIKTPYSVLNIVEHGDDVATMLELCFHGSTEDVVEAHLTKRLHRVGSTGLAIPQSTDAFAKYGWFSDPFAKRSIVKGESTNSLIGSFVEVTTPSLLFSATGVIESPTMRILFGKTGNIILDLKISDELQEQKNEVEKNLKELLDEQAKGDDLLKNQYAEAIAKLDSENIKTIFGTKAFEDLSITDYKLPDMSWDSEHNVWYGEQNGYLYEINGDSLELSITKIERENPTPVTTATEEDIRKTVLDRFGSLIQDIFNDELSNISSNAESSDTFWEAYGELFESIESDEVIEAFLIVTNTLTEIYNQLNTSNDINDLLNDLNFTDALETIKDSGELPELDGLQEKIDKLRLDLNQSGCMI